MPVSFVQQLGAFADLRGISHAASLILNNMRWQYLIAGAVAFIVGFLSRFLS